MKQALYASALTALAMLSAEDSQASQFIDTTIVNCVTANCSSFQLGGVVTNFAGTQHPWVAQVFALAGECLRLEGIFAPNDLALTVTGITRDVNGTIPGEQHGWFDDDTAGGLLPLIEIDPIPTSGFYTVSMFRWAGQAQDTQFVLLYGRYPSGNPNCSAPTIPTGSSVSSSK